MTQPTTKRHIEEVLNNNRMVNYEKFSKLVAEKLGTEANTKNYSDDLFNFVNNQVPGHGLGEIIYKVVRFQAQGDPNDLLKIAAWAFLEWQNYGRPTADLVEHRG